MSLKVGDPVIVYKTIWTDKKSKIGNISTIFTVNNEVVYGVKFEGKENSWGCTMVKQ